VDSEFPLFKCTCTSSIFTSSFFIKLHLQANDSLVDLKLRSHKISSFYCYRNGKRGAMAEFMGPEIRKVSLTTVEAWRACQSHLHGVDVQEIISQALSHELIDLSFLSPY
jgi:hypothetical protein